jgi:filamentous hemagglutinin family protein
MGQAPAGQESGSQESGHQTLDRPASKVGCGLHPRRLALGALALDSLALGLAPMALGSLAWNGLSDPSHAQIVPDATLPSNSVVSRSGPTFGITGGTQAGSTLFHSFQQFSVPVGQEAFFSNGDRVSAIVTRVTGPSLSTIDGTIRANGSANLFFLNPNGIVFGPRARIQVGGSFLATTADRFLFDNGDFFSASNTTSTPLLAVNLPIGLQYGSQSASIINRSLALNGAGALPGLTVQPGRTLGLVGGNVELQRGQISAQAAHVEIGSVAPGSWVAIAQSPLGFTLDYTETTTLQDINLSQGSLVDISGGGTLQMQGRQILLRDGSLVDANTLGNEAPGQLKLVARERLALLGTSLDGNTPSRITANVLPGATGRGSTVDIDAGLVRVEGGAQISVKTFGPGDAGQLSIRAGQVEVLDTSARLPSSISTEATRGATGRGGDLTIVTDRLLTRAGGEIKTSTDGAGDAGHLTIWANQVDLIGGSLAFPQSGLFTTAFSNATGRGGDLNLVVSDRLLLQNGGKIKAETEGRGDAGNVSIQARQMDVLGLLTADSVSFVSSTVRGETSSGRGGDLSIVADRLRVAEGGQIAAGTYGSGAGGTLTIQAKTIEVGGAPIGATNSGGIFTGPVSRSTGPGGDLSLTADTIRVLDGGVISSGTSGQGAAGNLAVKSGLLEVAGSSASGRSVSTVSTSVSANGTGQGGDLQIDSDRVLLRNGGQITAGTFGSGDAGSINIQANQVDILGVAASGRSSSGLFTSVASATATGQGGEIHVTANQVRVEDGGRISASTQGPGNAGSITVRADRLDVAGVSGVGNRRSSIAAAASTTTSVPVLGAAGSVVLDAQQLTVRDGASVTVSSAANSRGAGNLEITAQQVLLDRGGRLQAEVQSGTQGNISVQAQTVQLRRGSRISTNALGESAGGNIAIAADFVIATLQENSDITANAVNNFGGNVQITAKGIFGLQIQPELTPQSDITASSDRGPQFSGAITLDRPNLNPNQELTKLPDTPIDPTTQVTAACSDAPGNQFVMTGRGGLPMDARQPAEGSALWRDLRTEGIAAPERILSPESRSPSQPLPQEPTAVDPAIVEAQGWVIDADGQVTLTAAPVAAARMATEPCVMQRGT